MLSLMTFSSFVGSQDFEGNGNMISKPEDVAECGRNQEQWQKNGDIQYLIGVGNEKAKKTQNYIRGRENQGVFRQFCHVQ